MEPLPAQLCQLGEEIGAEQKQAQMEHGVIMYIQLLLEQKPILCHVLISSELLQDQLT